MASSEGRRVEAISVARPRDLRSSKEIMRWESIAVFQFVPTSEPALWVGDSIANGLEQAGFRVTAVGNVTDSKTPVALDIAITELGITYAGKPPLIGILYCTGELTIKATIFDHGQQTFERSYTGDDERQCCQSCSRHHVGNSRRTNAKDARACAA